MRWDDAQMRKIIPDALGGKIYREGRETGWGGDLFGGDGGFFVTSV